MKNAVSKLCSVAGQDCQDINPCPAEINPKNLKAIFCCLLEIETKTEQGKLGISQRSTQDYENTRPLISIRIGCIVIKVSFLKSRGQYANKWTGILKLLQGKLIWPSRCTFRFRSPCLL